MVWRETFRGVADSFRANRLRFILTLTGVMIGSSSLVMLSGLLAAGQDALVMASHQAEEDDLVEVSRNEPRNPRDRRRTTRQLDRGDVTTLDETALLGDARVVGQRRRWAEVYWKRNKKQVAIIGTRPDALDLYHLRLARGRFFSEEEVASRRPVAVVGHKVWEDLLEAAPSLDGLSVSDGNQRYVVIGALAHKPTFGGGDGPWQWDNRILIPETTLTAVTSPEEIRSGLHRIFIRLADLQALSSRMASVRGVVRETLLRRHYGVENFEFEGGEEEDGKEDLILMVISLLVLGTAIVSLIVGGINVMNIMLVSVTERTREIGIRRAVGAPRRQLMAQFLAESTITAGLGGVFGVGIGLGLTWIATRVLDKVVGGWPFHLVPWAPPLAIGAALLVGVVFGLYPAWRAARLDPVEALRFE
jgi:putative ABC transport system permease protein